MWPGRSYRDLPSGALFQSHCVYRYQPVIWCTVIFNNVLIYDYRLYLWQEQKRKFWDIIETNKCVRDKLSKNATKSKLKYRSGEQLTLWLTRCSSVSTLYPKLTRQALNSKWSNLPSSFLSKWSNALFISLTCSSLIPLLSRTRIWFSTAFFCRATAEIGFNKQVWSRNKAIPASRKI